MAWQIRDVVLDAFYLRLCQLVLSTGRIDRWWDGLKLRENGAAEGRVAADVCIVGEILDKEPPGFGKFVVW